MMEYKLAELFDLQMGKTPSRNNPLYWNSNDNAWVSIADLSETDGKYVTRTKEFLTDKAVVESGIKQIPANTVIMSFKLSIGKVAITPVAMYSNEAIMAFIDKGIEKIVPDYLYYLFLHKNWNKGTNKAVMGITLNKKILSDTSIYLHSIEEQKAIIEILDKVTDLIAKRKSQLLALDDLIKARFVEMFGDLYLNTFKWDMKTIGELCTEIKSGLSRKLSNSDIGLPVIRSTNMINGELNTDDIKFWYVKDPQGACTDNYVLNDGDILVNFINSIAHIGKVCIFKDIGRPCIYTTNILRMQLNESCNKYFFKYFTQTDCYTHQLKRIIQPAVNQASFTTVNYKKILIPLPPVELQKTFEDFVTQVDKSKVEVQRSLEKTQMLFDSLMQQYFG